MEKLVEIIKMVANKYMGKITLILADHYLTLECLTIKNEQRDVYKSMKVEPFADMLKIYIYEDKIERIVDIEQLEDIIKVLEKQSTTRKFTPEEIRYIKEKYAPNTKVELIQMYDLVNDVPPNTKGIVTHVDDIGNIHVNWENGITLALTFGTDEFSIIE